MCPRLTALKDRHLILPRGSEVPEILKSICEANLDSDQAPMYWDQWVHLIASVHSGHTSAVSVMARFGSAARGDPLYEVGVGIGRLLRTIFLAAYFVKPALRSEPAFERVRHVLVTEPAARKLLHEYRGARAANSQFVSFTDRTASAARTSER